MGQDDAVKVDRPVFPGQTGPAAQTGQKTEPSKAQASAPQAGEGDRSAEDAAHPAHKVGAVGGPAQPAQVTIGQPFPLGQGAESVINMPVTRVMSGPPEVLQSLVPGFKFQGPGFYLSNGQTILVFPVQPQRSQAWQTNQPAQTTYQMLIVNATIDESLFDVLAQAPVRQDNR